MLATIPVNEMAETLRVLAGANAGNAARHFTKRSHDMGDVAGAVLWTSIADIVVSVAPVHLAACAPAEACAMPPVPQRMKQLLEATAFAGVRFEDVDADVLMCETLHEALEAEHAPQADNMHSIPAHVTPPESQDAAMADGEPEGAWRLPLAA